MGRLSEFYLDGETYQPGRDKPRLQGQLAAVCSVLSDYQWHTLEELATRCSASQAGVSARLRDLRKARFGSQTIEKRYINNGLWEYRLSSSNRTTGP